MKKTRLIAYGRVSTGSDDQQNSFTNQQKYFDDKYSNHPEYEYLGFIGDEGRSGTNLVGRPELIKLLERAGLKVIVQGKNYHIEPTDKEPEFDMIVCKDISRFGRSVVLVDAINKLRDKKVYLYLEQQNLNTKDRLTGEVMVKILMTLAEQDSIDKSAKVVFGLEESKKNGIINNTRYGYIKEGIGKNARLVINEPEAEVIRLLYELYAEGKGIRLILQEFNRRGIVSPKGKPFAPTTLKKFLDQPLYKGQFVRNRYSKGSLFEGNQQTHSKVKPESEWIKFDDVAPEIVSPELWGKVQKIRAGKVNAIERKGKKPETSEYAGILICDNCESVYTSNREKRTSRSFYNCKLKKQKGVSACASRNVPIGEIERKLESYCSGGFYELYLRVREHTIKQIEKRKQVVIQSYSKVIDTVEIERIQKELNEVRGQQRILTLERIKKSINENLYDELIVPLNNVETELSARIKELTQTEEQMNIEVAKFDDEIRALLSLEQKERIEKVELMKHVDSIRVTDTGLQVLFKIDTLTGGNMTVSD